MIDITVYDNQTRVDVDMVEHTIASQRAMVALINDILYKACYSGETITLWKAIGEDKYLISEFHSNPPSTY